MKPSSLFHELILGEHARGPAEFDGKYEAPVNRVIADIERTFTTLTMVTIYDTKLFPGARFDSFSLLNEALGFLVSGLHLVRQGRRTEALALLRISVEGASVAMHIALEPKAYARYADSKGKRYSSLQAVSFAKPHIHRIGEFWGGLSNAAVHPNRRAFGPRIGQDGALAIHVGRQSPNPKEEELALAFVSTASLMVLRATEIALFTPDPQDRVLVILEGTGMKMRAVADDLVRESFVTLDRLSSHAID